MKKLISLVSLVSALAMIITSTTTAFGATTAPLPSVGDAKSSASVAVGDGGQHVQRQALASGDGVTILVTPMLLAAQPSLSWTVGAQKALADCLGGKLTNSLVSSAGDYSLCSYRIEWSNLVYSTSAPMWAGVLNPSSPFDGQYGQVVWALVDVRAKPGGTVSLDEIAVSFRSSDGGGVLNGSVAFGTNSYSQLAIGIEADGKMVTSGLGSQRVVRIIVFIQSKLFDCGSTQAGLDSVKNWVASHVLNNWNYGLTYTASVGENMSYATVRVVGLPAQPRMMIGSDKSIWAMDGKAGESYRVLSESSLPTVGWELIGVVNGTNVFNPTSSSRKQFFKLLVQ